MLTSAITTIGSDPTSDIAVGDPGVAAQHAQIGNGDGSWRMQRAPAGGAVTVDDRPIHSAGIVHTDRRRAARYACGQGAGSALVPRKRTVALTVPKVTTSPSWSDVGWCGVKVVAPTCV